jgi:CHASE3 domain sensor protein
MSLGAKIGTGFAVALAIIVAIGVRAYVSTERLLEANRSVLHTHEVEEKLDDVLAAHLDTETGQRGFLLTGEDRYLEPYNAGVGQIQHDIVSLADLTRDNPSQQESIQKLRKLSEAKLAELRDTIQLRRKSGQEAALAVVRSDRGKKFMDELRGVGKDCSISGPTRPTRSPIEPSGRFACGCRYRCCFWALRPHCWCAQRDLAAPPPRPPRPGRNGVSSPFNMPRRRRLSLRPLC